MAAPVHSSPLLSVAQAAERLSVSEKTVRRLIARGELPAVQLGGQRGPIRLDERELIAWLYRDPREAA